MRKGDNPQRNKEIGKSIFSHRIIIPVYIPNINGYYKDSFEILKISIKSVVKTVNTKTAITIVSNGSCKVVVNYLNDLFVNDSINELILTGEVGKLNAILKALRGSDESFITIADADVLFKKNWQKETFKIFENFSKAGVVGIVPQFKLYENFAKNVIFDNLFKKCLKYTKVKDPEGLRMFYKSIGWKNDYNKDYLKYNLSLMNKDCVALVGSGHFVATYKRSIFDNSLPFSKHLLGGSSESLFLDIPTPKKNLWRLTTEGNFAFHMGNILEDWMVDYEKNKLEYKNIHINFPKTNDKLKDNSIFLYYIKQKIFSKLFSKKWFKIIFFKQKGLPIDVAKKY